MIFLMDYYPEFALVPFMLIIGVVAAYVILAKPFTGLMIYLVFLLIRPQEFVPFLMAVPIPLERIVAIMLIVSMLIFLKREYRMKINITSIDYGIVIFILVCLLSVVSAIWITGAWETWNKLLRLGIVYLFISQLIRNRKQFKGYVIFVILAAAFHASAAVIRYYMGIRELEMGIERATGIDLSYGDPNSLAPTIIYTLPLVYCYFVSTSSKMIKAFLIMISLVMLWCVVLTGSRTGFAGLAFFGLMVLYFNKSKFRNLIIILIAMFVLIPFIPGQYIERFESITDLGSNNGAAQSAHGRIDGLILGMKMMLDRPILGYGIGCYGIANALIYTHYYYESHSLPGQIFGELGLLGLIVFIIWMYALFKGIKRLKQYFSKFRDRDKFLYNVVIALNIELLLLFFIGLAGHNLYRYNWFILSGAVTVLLNMIRSDGPIGEPEPGPGPTEAV
nr:O-antigen ligase family protein [candidate division Zixibacteria bacterium]